MQVLHIRLGYFKITLHVGIVFKDRSSLKSIQTIQMGFFEVWVLHLGLILHLNLQYPDLYFLLPTRILRFRCNTYTRIYFYQLQFWGFVAYLHPYLPLPIGILGLHCNTYTRTYFYQLEFWGFVAIPTPILTFTNQNFGASL